MKIFFYQLILLSCISFTTNAQCVPTSSTTTVAVCPAEMPYSWNGTDYGAEGSYTIHLTNAGGCDSATTLELIIKVLTVADTVAGPKNACAYTGVLGGNATYHIVATNATSFVWTLPQYAVLVSGQGNDSILVHFTSSFSSGSISVAVTNDCSGSFARLSTNLPPSNATAATPVTSQAPPPKPKVEGGGTLDCELHPEDCAPDPIVYQVDNIYYTDHIQDVIIYEWVLPTDMVMVTHTPDYGSIGINFNNNFNSGYIKVRAISGCGNSIYGTLLVTSPTPATPGMISGSNNACVYIGTANLATYTVNRVKYATHYTWNMPVGATILSHPGGVGTANDTIIRVSFDNSFVDNTNITVSAGRGCCRVSPGVRSLAIRRVLAGTPGTITGATDVCEFMKNAVNPAGTPVLYSIRKVSNANSYLWKVPPGASVTHPAGLGVNDTAISVTFPSSLVNDTIQVSAKNGCGISSARIKLVSRSLPSSPGAITGPTDVCSYAFNGTDATYTIRKLSGSNQPSSYNWQLSDPTFAHIVSHNAGEGTANDTSVNIHFDAGFISCSVSVKSVRGCGESSARSLTVTKKAPTMPSVIGNPAPCAQTTEAYTANSATGSSYIWTVPSNMGTFTGQNTPTILISFKSTFTQGNISVKAVSVCGTSLIKTYPLTSCGSRMIVQSLESKRSTKMVSDKSTIKEAAGKFEILVNPNPSNGDFMIIIKNAKNQLNSDVVIDLINEWGQVVYHAAEKKCFGIVNVKTNSKLASGVYTVSCMLNGEKANSRLIIHHQ